MDRKYDLKYESKLPDETLYELRLSFKDEGLYRKIVHALEKQRAGSIVDGGLLKILSDLNKILPKGEILEYKR